MLRGINLGSARRVAMPTLRELLTSAGYQGVRTYAQSGNVVLAGDAPAPDVQEHCGRLISEQFGFDVDVVVRTRTELSQVVKANPLGDVADDDRRYQVSFLSAVLDPEAVDRLQALVKPPEALAVLGRELYAWHPAGVARSKLSAQLAGPGLGVIATARNWTTVTTLLRMAQE